MDLYSSEGRQQSAASVTFAHPSSFVRSHLRAEATKDVADLNREGKSTFLRATLQRFVILENTITVISIHHLSSEASTFQKFWPRSS